MTDRELFEKALTALTASSDLIGTMYLRMDAITALRERLAQTERHELQAKGEHPAPCARHCEATAFQIVIKNLKAQLAQPEPEPVGDEWTPCIKLPVIVHVRKQRPGETHVSTREGITPVNSEDLIMRGVSGEEYPIGRAIFEQTYSLDTTPPQRTWVGLTDEEMVDLQDRCGISIHQSDFEAIEAKLKEKNT